VNPCGFTSPTPSTRRRKPAQCPVCGRRSKVARGHRPSLRCLRRRVRRTMPASLGGGLPSPPFRSRSGFPFPPCPPTSPLPALFGTFSGTTPMSDFPAACMSGLRPRAFPDRPHGPRPLGNCWDLPVLEHRVSAHARVFDSVGSGRRSRSCATARMAFPTCQRGRHAQSCDFGAQWLAYAYPYPCFTCGVTVAGAGRGAMVARYAFHVGLLHP